jgi:hypothetical protein
MSSEENNYIADANECEMKAKEALDLSVKRYFAKLARDYRHLAEPEGDFQNKAPVSVPRDPQLSNSTTEVAIKLT